MDRNSFAAHEGMKEGRRSPEYLAARERFAQEQTSAARRARLTVAALLALVAVDVVLWAPIIAGWLA